MKTKDKISEKFNILVIIPKHPPIPFSCRDFYERDRGTGERLSEGINDDSRSPPVVQYSRRSRIKTSNEHLIEKTWFSTRVRNWFDIVHTAWKLYRNLNNFDKVMGPADKHVLITNESENPRWLARVTLGESELSLNQRNQTTTND